MNDEKKWIILQLSTIRNDIFILFHLLSLWSCLNVRIVINTRISRSVCLLQRNFHSLRLNNFVLFFVVRVFLSIFFYKMANHTPGFCHCESPLLHAINYSYEIIFFIVVDHVMVLFVWRNLLGLRLISNEKFRWSLQ